MNKKDIANIRKQFKLDNNLLVIKEIFNVYVQKESGDIYHHVSQPFGLLDREAQELFLQNFKKVLTGHLDTKLFELRFKKDVEDSTQTILYDALHTELTEDWKEQMLQLVERMFAHTVYEFDTVVTFIKADYRKPKKKRDQHSEEGGDDETYYTPIILCTLNKTDQPKKALLFDYVEKAFKPNNAVDPIINLSTPLTGFLYPTFNNYAADTNHILYFTGKANQPDEYFIEDVLNCEGVITSAEDKDYFEQVLKNVIGETVDSEVISNVYEEIDRMVQIQEEDEETADQEPPMLDYKDVERILTVSGVENVNQAIIEDAFKEVIDDERYEFKSTSVVPKTIKIKTKVANLSLSPKELKYVKYVKISGKRCLLLEIDEEVEVEGLKLETTTF